MAHPVSPLRRAVLTAYALHVGYEFEAVSWKGSFEDELAEGWVWRMRGGFSIGDTVVALTEGEFPMLPDCLLEELDDECPWRTTHL